MVYGWGYDFTWHKACAAVGYCRTAVFDKWTVQHGDAKTLAANGDYTRQGGREWVCLGSRLGYIF